MATKIERTKLAEIMDLLVAQQARVHYRQSRPMSTRGIRDVRELREWLALPHGVSMDCSESVTLICRLAGLRDPNGLSYNGAGYTGTILAAGERRHGIYRQAHGAGVGALVVFGDGTGDHVCMVRHPGADPILFSHGQESGPFYIRLGVEARYHSGAVRFVSIAGL